MKTENELIEEATRLYFRNAQKEFPGCSPDAPSFSRSSVDNNIVTLRNGRGALAQFVVNKANKLKQLSARARK